MSDITVPSVESEKNVCLYEVTDLVAQEPALIQPAGKP